MRRGGTDGINPDACKTKPSRRAGVRTGGAEQVLATATVRATNVVQLFNRLNRTIHRSAKRPRREVGRLEIHEGPTRSRRTSGGEVGIMTGGMPGIRIRPLPLRLAGSQGAPNGLRGRSNGDPARTIVG